MSKQLLQHLVVFLTYCVVTFAVSSFLLGMIPDTGYFIGLILGGIVFTCILAIIRKRRRNRE